MIPHRVAMKIGGFSIEKFTELSQDDVRELMRKTRTIARLVETMAIIFT